MDIREWSLIIFTILAQMSVGAFVALVIVHFFVTRKAGVTEADRMSDRALLAIGPVLILGLLASLFHLGTPLQAYLAVSNLGTSWLSREILFGVLFALGGFIFAIMQWRKFGSLIIRRIMALITAVLGLALVYSMSQVYMLETQPAWNTLATPISFFVSTFLLGGLAIGAAFVINYSWVKKTDPSCAEVQCELLRGSLRGIALGAVLLLGIEFITTPLLLAYLAGGDAASRESASLLGSQFALLQAFRLALVFLGAGVLGFFLYANASSTGRERVMGNLAIGAFVLVLAAQLIGRYVFYAAHVRIGI
ncbi:MAG: dimethyl sulfoxide reductase anchor subunit [Anaerolineales bacterium]|nr:dimethyl sulfoxide reductase anchor subunit [Anaerolineales bacterium]